MNKKTVLAMLLVSGALITPAYANYFSNPYTGITLNIGSAPNPTPADIRVDRLPTVTEDQSAPAAPVAQNPQPAQPNTAMGQIRRSVVRAVSWLNPIRADDGK